MSDLRATPLHIRLAPVLTQLGLEKKISWADAELLQRLLDRHEAPFYPPGSMERMSDLTAPQGESGTHPKEFVIRHISALRALGIPDASWIVERFLVEGAITELAAWVKVGKSTLMLQMIASVLHGTPFLGRYEVQQGAVILLTEERRPSLFAALEEVGVTDQDPLHVAMWHEQNGLPWQEVATRAATEVQRLPAKLLVIDTLGRWAGVDDENDAAKAELAMGPLQSVAGALQLSVAVVRQAGKSLRETQNSGRGSSAYAGAADILVHLGYARDEHGKPLELDPRRWLHVISRFERDPVAPMVLDYRNRLYEAIEATNVDQSAADRVLTDISLYGPAKPFDVVQRTQLNPGTVRSAIHRLVRRNLVSETEGSYQIFTGSVATGGPPLRGDPPPTATPANGRTVCPACGNPAFEEINGQRRCWKCHQLY